MSGSGLLITGFGPFPGMPLNPSAALARRVGALCRLRAPAMPVRVLVLRTAYEALPRMLGPALDDRPVAVLMIGVAGRSRRVRVEDCARARASRLHPDASGRTQMPERGGAGEPLILRSRSVAPALACLKRHGVPTRRSHDAGRYLCNAAYRQALAENPAALFVHIPPVSRTRRPRRDGAVARSGPALTAALAEIALGLVVRARRASQSRAG